MSNCDDGSLHMLLTQLFKMAWPVWKKHRGKVPKKALRQLEIYGDWPPGWATPIMARISRDAELRLDLEKWLSIRRKRKLR